MPFIAVSKNVLAMIAVGIARVFREITKITKHHTTYGAISCTVTSVVIPMVTDTARAYTAEQPIAVAMERVEEIGRRQVGLNWRKTK